jgi:hypothetical protein
MTYSEKSTQLALDASIAVLVLTNAQFDDVEFLPLKPRQMTESEKAELVTRWPGRGLCSIGVLGLVGMTPRSAFKEPLEPEQVTALAGAFLAYLHALFSDRFAEQLEGAEIAELERIYALGGQAPEKFN